MTPAIILDVLIAALLIAAALRGCWRGLFLSVSGTLVWVFFGKSLLASLRKELKNKEIEQDK